MLRFVLSRFGQTIAVLFMASVIIFALMRLIPGDPVLMVLGDIIQQATTEEDMSIVGGALAATTIMLWAVGISYAAFRSKRVRGVLEERPTIVIAHGVVDETILKIERLTAEELSEEARNAGIADLADVEWGLLEADGRFSFITKQGNRPPPPGHDLT